ncbi:MAG: FliH/SctL family protein [Geobacteraceae bacterium]|nr:FliH/SctL family protein [Geobacteraceae bacterium]
MSSSNIIKPRQTEGVVVEPYRFASADGAGVPATSVRASGFVPFLETITGDILKGPPADPVPEEGLNMDCADGHCPPSVPPEPPGISEEEALLRVQEGYDKGFAEGKRQAERGLSSVFRALRDAVDALTGLRERILLEAEDDLLLLSVMIARKVINQEITTDRMILARVIAAAVNSASEKEEIVIRLNPEDHRLVSAHKSLYLSGFNVDRLLDIKSDDSVTPGGCIVDTAMGEIDARVDAQLDEIFKKLTEEKKTFTAMSRSLVTEREQHAYEEN